jgi:tetratricopeptide (TPR) repeat protein
MIRFQAEDKAKLKRQRVEQAVKLAMDNKWEEAVEVNRSIIALFTGDVDAYNRLGKSLTELGRYTEARDAYQKALDLDPMNRIAEKNLSRLANVSAEALDVTHKQLEPRLFIEETGKTGVTSLVQLGDKEAVSRMAAGDEVYLEADGRALVVKNPRGEYLGKVEPRLSQRLIDLMNGGNKYAAGVISLSESQLTILIREMERHPSQSGRVSFPFKPNEAASIRPYIKSSLIQQYDLEDDDEDDFSEEEEATAEESDEESGGSDIDTEEEDRSS